MRCNNKNDKDYRNYGARGIKVCKRWSDNFYDFVRDMGLKPSTAHSLDRYPDNDGNYDPSNCRWATIVQQNRNRSCSKITEATAEQIRTRFANGERNKDLAKEFDLHVTMVSYIVHHRYWK